MNALLPTDTNQTAAPLALWRVAGAFMRIPHALCTKNRSPSAPLGHSPCARKRSCAPTTPRQAYTRRLSRRLHATPQRICELLHAPPEARHRIDRCVELARAAETSAMVFNTS